MRDRVLAPTSKTYPPRRPSAERWHRTRHTNVARCLSIECDCHLFQQCISHFLDDHHTRTEIWHEAMRQGCDSHTKMVAFSTSGRVDACWCLQSTDSRSLNDRAYIECRCEGSSAKPSTISLVHENPSVLTTNTSAFRCSPLPLLPLLHTDVTSSKGKTNEKVRSLPVDIICHLPQSISVQS